MRILVTNDDGIYSPGLLKLAEVASRFGEVRVVAPDVEQSSMAQAVTATRPLRHRSVRIGNVEAFKVDGTPSDCVALGAFVWGHVDVVFSGINIGLNVGNAMWHSGTLAAAKQAALLGFRGIAFSAPEVEGVTDYAPIFPYAERVARELLALPSLRLLNVNFPAAPKGVRWTRQSVRHYDGRVVAAKDPYGRANYWFTSSPTGAPEADSDREAVEEGFVSITPLRLDLTDHDALDAVRSKAAE